MSNSRQNKPGKSGQRPRKSGPSQGPTPEQASSPAAHEPDILIPIEAAASTPGAFPMAAAAAAPENMPSIDMQTIALAYGEYTRKSFEQTKSFVEKLAGARSLDKAMEIQTEFAKQAYETFVADSQKIRELYSGLAKQSFEGAVATVIQAAR